MQNHPTHKNTSGFTLIELLTSIAIIGVLAGVAIQQYSLYKINAYDAHSKQALHDIHLLCNNYWGDTDSEQECDLAKSKEYGFVQHSDVVATLPSSPLDTFCASAKHNSPGLARLGGQGHGNHLLKTYGLGNMQKTGSHQWSWWVNCTHLNNTHTNKFMLIAEDLESARHFPYAVRARASQDCIMYQSQCLDPSGLGSPANGKEFEQKGCPELLAASCSIKPVGLLNTPGTLCNDGLHDCSIKYDITSPCSTSYNAMNPGCKGFVDREVFEETCHRGRMGSNWKEQWKGYIEEVGKEAFSHVSARMRACSSYVAGMMTNQFK